ncbi:MAG: 1-acyl-sn-glycerol-3-phosphate acyltransferase [Actinomycetota bacterium]|nr:1-acyl-sn-glycerol-3-phosphate acyltransferase [Actinomycetota bacterium]
MDPVYRLVVALIVGVFRLMGWRVSVSGAEHLPRTGPAVVATNHVGYLDFTFVGYGGRQRGRLLRFLAKQEIFDHPLAGPLMRAMKHIPVDRFGRAAHSFEVAVAALRRGEVIGMFPEGTISPSFVPMAGKTGAARMAMAASAPLLPGAVWGSQRLLTKGKPHNFRRGVAVSVIFGAPVPYGPDDDVDEVTARLMAAIRDLVDRAAAEYPQRPAGEDDRWWLPAHLGGTAPTVGEAEEITARERAARRERRRRQRQD